MDEPKQNQSVAIYSTPTCHFCQMTKEFFAEHGVEYVNYDVSKDTVRRQEMFDITNQMGVPVIVIGNDVVIGFDKEKLEELLGITAAV
jgi:glutaredoxin-like YruB-family protein